MRASDETGTSLLEVVVGLAIMSIFMGMFTTAILTMTTGTTKSQAINLASGQLNQAFQNLDKTVRYATAISTPGVGTPSGDAYVEFRSTNTGSEVCTQLRADIASQQLQRRTWTIVNSVASTASGWAPLASGISNGGVTSGTDQPFALVPIASSSVAFQQLVVNLVAPTGNGASKTTSRSSLTFTAVNSTIPVPTAPICQQAGRP